MTFMRSTLLETLLQLPEVYMYIMKWGRDGNVETFSSEEEVRTFIQWFDERSALLNTNYNVMPFVLAGLFSPYQ